MTIVITRTDALIFGAVAGLVCALLLGLMHLMARGRVMLTPWSQFPVLIHFTQEIGENMWEAHGVIRTGGQGDLLVHYSHAGRSFCLHPSSPLIKQMEFL
jgi:hypothetical protein